MSEVKQGHPKGLYILFVTEMWERFSYYGMRAIFVLFLTKALLFDKEGASNIYGSYTGLVYLTPLIGGYMADRYWGNRKSIIIGGIIMALGQFMMFFSSSFYENLELAKILMLAGITMLIIGNGFFKPNISTMVGQLYPKGDKRIDSAFTIFYMGINLGAFIAPLVAGGLGDTGNPADFKYGFLAAGLGMTLSVILFVWLKNHYIVTPEGQQIGVAPNKNREVSDVDTVAEAKSEFSKTQIITWLGIEAALFVLFFFLEQGVVGSFIFSLSIAAPGFIISDKSLTKIEKERIWVIYIVAFFVIFFWSAFEQAGASLTFFAEEQTVRDIGLHLSKGLLTIIYGGIAAVLAYIAYVAFAKMKGEQKGVKELILALLLGGIGFLIYLTLRVPSVGQTIETIPASYFQSINAIAIVIFAPIFSVMWTKLGDRNREPASPYKQSIGLFLLAVGYLVIAFGVDGIDASTKVSLFWLTSLYLIHTFGELALSPIGLAMVNKLAPVKFASLLMGVWFLSTSAANKFAGTLSSLYPETMIVASNVQEQEAQTGLKLVGAEDVTKAIKEIDGVKYFSLDAISLAKVQDKTVKAGIMEHLFKNSIVKEKSIAGYKINNLHSFFMLFVFMAGIASVILFFLSKKLLQMMHGVR